MVASCCFSLVSSSSSSVIRRAAAGSGVVKEVSVVVGSFGVDVQGRLRGQAGVCVCLEDRCPWQAGQGELPPPSYGAGVSSEEDKVCSKSWDLIQPINELDVTSVVFVYAFSEMTSISSFCNLINHTD